MLQKTKVIEMIDLFGLPSDFKSYVYKADDVFSIGNYAYLFDNDYENTLTREVWKIKFSAFIMNELKPIPSIISVLIVQFIFGTDYCFHPEKFDCLCEIHS